MSDETLYDVVPERDGGKFNDTKTKPKAWIVEVSLERAMEELEMANERYEEYGIEFSVKKSTGEREMTRYRQDQVEQ